MTIANDNLAPPPPCRVASWSGSLSDTRNSYEVKTLGEALVVSPSVYMLDNSPSMQIPSNHNSSNDLHEVEL